ncbi:MAG: DNA starvation/stationary phase protection protein [Leadbetterella sp.]|nr:DNA starvation/stationary phase protection protein [Leadbetterella sp.]
MNTIGIKDNTKVTKFLTVLLADEFVLYMKTRNAHWNVEGPDFHTMHIYFEQQYNELALIVDEVAERLRKLDHYATASLTDYLKLTHLSEKPLEKNDSLSFIQALLSDYESIIIYIREQLEALENQLDKGTDDFITGLLEQHEKTAWMLRAHLK